MALTDLPTTIPTSRTRDEHIADHTRLHGRLRGNVYSDDYATLQLAVNDAFAKSRPLVIAPGFHVLSAPLQLYGIDHQDISAYGAILQADSNMAAILDMSDCSRCTWRGGRFKVSPGVTVDNAIFIYGGDFSQCTRNLFRDVIVQGPYTTGIRIGKIGNTCQCDHMYLDNVECSGDDLAGQIGIYAGTGIFANCLNHTFRNITLSGHDTHVYVSATNTYWTGVFMDRASTSDWFLGATNFSVANVRSESGNRMLITGGPATAAAVFSFADILWRCDQLAADGEFVRAYMPGLLRLRSMDVRAESVPPKIKTSCSAPLIVDIDGMVNRAPYSGLLDVDVNTQVVTHNYVEANAAGSVLSATP